MIKQSLITYALALSAGIGYSQTQKDTIWHDYHDLRTLKSNASGYRFVIPTKTDLALVESYDLQHHKLSSGLAFVDQQGSITYQGIRTTYQQDGQELNRISMEDGVAKGSVVSFLQDGTSYEGQFKDGLFTDGFFATEHEDCYSLVQAKNGQVIKATLFSKAGKSYRQVMHFKDHSVYLEETFNPDGTLLGKITYDDLGPITGKKVRFNYQPLRVESLEEYKDRVLLRGESYYSDGTIKSKTTTEDRMKIDTFYDKQQKVLGTLTTQMDEYSNIISSTGTKVNFKYQNGPKDLIEQIIFLQDNLTVLVDSYDEQGLKETSTQYNKDGSGYSKITYFHKDGSIKDELQYAEDGYTPWEGTLRTPISESSYSQGELIKETNRYQDGKIFEIKQDLKSVYYDRNNKVIANLSYIQEDGIWMPYHGTQLIMYADHILAKANYDQGELTHQISYKIFQDNIIKDNESFYTDSQVVKTITYHNNGKVFRDETFESYEPLYSKFYDNTGKLLGSFDHKNLDGTLLEFFENNTLKSSITYKKGVKQYEKNYVEEYQDYPLNSLNPAQVYLESEIDYFKQGKFYDKGKLISTVEYKNAEPYQGTVYINQEYVQMQTPYKNGLKDGLEISYSIFYPEVVVEKTLYQQGEKVYHEEYLEGNIISRIPFQDDLYHGEAIFYDSQQQEHSRLTYQFGEPYQGTSTTDLFGSILTRIYSQGTLISITETSDQGQLYFKKVRSENDPMIFNTQVYDYDLSVRLTYQTYDDIYLHGTVSYYLKDKLMHQATFNKGVLESGSVALNYKGNDAYASEGGPKDWYYILSKKGNMIHHQLFNSQNQLIDQYEIKTFKSDVDATSLFQLFTSEDLYPELERNKIWYY